jgi:Reverse transcriptase (RNA-dependent DNA polymerase)
LTHFWDNLWLAPRQGGFFGKPLKSNRGVTQGDPLSQVLLNIMIDAVVRQTKHILGTEYNSIIFYADDGLITGNNKEQLQRFLDTMIQLLANLGLKINPEKTKILVGHPSIINHRIASPVFNRRFGGNEVLYAEYCTQQVTCTICNIQIQRISLN